MAYIWRAHIYCWPPLNSPADWISSSSFVGVVVAGRVVDELVGVLMMAPYFGYLIWRVCLMLQFSSSLIRRSINKTTTGSTSNCAYWEKMKTWRNSGSAHMRCVYIHISQTWRIFSLFSCTPVVPNLTYICNSLLSNKLPPCLPGKISVFPPGLGVFFSCSHTKKINKKYEWIFHVVIYNLTKLEIKQILV
jgi:hypothetical protein